MFDYLKFEINFRDCATLYAYDIINLHHSILYWLIIVLAFVYWTFYYILKDYLWYCFNRRGGVLKFFYTSPFWFIIGLLSYMFVYAISMFVLLPLLYFSMNLLRLWRTWSYDFLNNSTHLDVFLLLLVNFCYLHLVLNCRLVFSNFSIKVESGEFFNLMLTPFYFWSCLKEIVTYKKFHQLQFGEISTKAYYNTSNTRSAEDQAFLEMRGFNHSLTFEYAWTVFPLIIIVIMIIPSWYLLFSVDSSLSPVFTLRVIGHQWFWSYEITSPTLGINYQIDSNLTSEDDLSIEGSKRLLEVDNRLYLPVNVPFRVLVTSGDVLHSWAVPELGVKLDAVPGRLNETIMSISRPGVFYGQCSELCGVGHGFMPIVVEAVSFEKWLSLVRPEMPALVDESTDGTELVCEGDDVCVLPRGIKGELDLKEFLIENSDFPFKAKIDLREFFIDNPELAAQAGPLELNVVREYLKQHPELLKDPEYMRLHEQFYRDHPDFILLAAEAEVKDC